MKSHHTSDPDAQRRSFSQVLLEEMSLLKPEAVRKFNEAQRTDADGKGEEVPGDDSKDENGSLRGLYRELGHLATEDAFSALCFSGGGIRSATFNLGILQRLARSRLVRKFDYLSSVSGGGYIASWVRTWLSRVANATADADPDMEKRLEEAEAALGGRDRDRRNPLQPAPPQLNHLREFSNYLTPKLGLFSADTWTLAAIVIRNLLLNWLIILPLLSVLAAGPLFALLVSINRPYGPGLFHTMLPVSFGIALFASIATHASRRFAGIADKNGTIVQAVPWWVAHVAWVATGLAAMSLTVTGLGLSLPTHHGSPPIEASDIHRFAVYWCVGVPLVGWFLAQAVYMACGGRHGSLSQWKEAGLELAGLLVSGLVAACALILVIRQVLPYWCRYPAGYAILAFPTLLGIYLIARTIFVAFASSSDPSGKAAPSVGEEDSDREWWARLSGWLLVVGVFWLILSFVCIAGTHWLWIVEKNPIRAHVLVGLVGSASGLITAALGASSKTAASDASSRKAQSSSWVDWAIAIAAPLFAVCVFVLVAQCTVLVGQWLLAETTGVTHALRLKTSWKIHKHHLLPEPATVVYFLLVPGTLLLFAWFAGWLININRFSLQGMYRNRLVRAYLGASKHPRHPNAFTGFDATDNLHLHELLPPDADERKSSLRPLPIINTALNLMETGSQLAWQQRKAESFSMTPLFCGNFEEGYRSSRLYGGPDGITVGTAIAISGAAANPNMGSSTSPVMRFLLGLFNLRLGAWLGNTNTPGDKSFRHSGPVQAIIPMLAELFGLTAFSNAYVNLSDGGHFDNLGLYEVVLRRCRNIVVCDAGCDPDFTFEDLGNAIRKIRIDFGIPIAFSGAINILSRTDKAEHGVYCAVGTIGYGEVDGADVANGTIVYIKPTLRVGKPHVPYDVFSYGQQSSSFPHETTADQWFSESQFESYRALGSHALDAILGEGDIGSVAELVTRVNSYMDSAARASTPPVA